MKKGMLVLYGAVAAMVVCLAISSIQNHKGHTYYIENIELPNQYMSSESDESYEDEDEDQYYNNQDDEEFESDN